MRSSSLKDHSKITFIVWGGGGLRQCVYYVLEKSMTEERGGGISKFQNPKPYVADPVYQYCLGGGEEIAF